MARRIEVFLPWLETPGIFASTFVGISAQTMLADSIRARRRIRDENSGVIAALAPDHLAAGETVNASQVGAFRQRKADPTRLRGRAVG
jgi:hypothetical protein